ncbi:MAG: DUF3581 family protein [Kangiellaceae bacterium]
MFTQKYYQEEDQQLFITRKQGSNFAKDIAGDFNPLHDEDNSRFCVPGDLLFSIMLSQFGISHSMSFNFQGMIAGRTPFNFEANVNEIIAKNENDKPLITLNRSGEVTRNEVFIEGLIRSYVAFSGKTFPHILVELMLKEQKMINTKKPMVIYDSMKLSFDRFTETAPSVELNNCQFDVNGKRGMVTMNFDLMSDTHSIGKGEKQIIMSGLREYDQNSIDELVKTYDDKKNNWKLLE